MSVAVVTGAGRGLGRETARVLAARGHSVVAVDIDSGSAVSAAAEAGGKGFGCDVADRDAVRDLAGRIGPVDVLVNNAGIWRFGPLIELSPADVAEVVNVNLLGTLWCVQAFAPGMAGRGGGSVINLSSRRRPGRAGADHPGRPARASRRRRRGGRVPGLRRGQLRDGPGPLRGRRPHIRARHLAMTGALSSWTPTTHIRHSAKSENVSQSRVSHPATSVPSRRVRMVSVRLLGSPARGLSSLCVLTPRFAGGKYTRSGLVLPGSRAAACRGGATVV
jgi:NAD(P)-dependent dehydrogenase (short-subunit alcohol dehydrogenase family)